MTKQRDDEHSTEFGLWLRNKAPDNETILRQPDPLDSALGYTTTNIDYFWHNYNTHQWMLLEEKRYGGMPKFYQIRAFKILHQLAKIDPKYCGFYLVRFEKTNPRDGWTQINEKVVTEQQLLEFLKFNYQAPLVETCRFWH